MIRYRFCIMCAIVAAAAALVIALAQTPSAFAGPTQPVSFINDVAPILKEHCYTCHDAKKKSGKLEMTSYAALRRGGKDGDPVQTGQPSESELYDRLVTDGTRRMPPPDKAGPLPPAKIAVIERWIAEGAKLDAGLDADANLLRELRRRWQPPTPPEKYPATVPITAIAFSPDGTRLATSGYYEINFWDARSGQLVKRLRTRTERAHGIAFLSDNRLAVAGGRPGEEGDVRLYDLGSNAMTHLFDTDDSVLCLAVSKDGQLLAAGGCDRTARVWELNDSRKLIATVTTHADWVQGVAFALDGRVLLTASRDKTAKSYDLDKSVPLVNFPDHQAPVHAVAARADGKLAYSVGADKALRLWKPDGDGKQVRALGGHTDEVVRIAIHPTKPGLATVSLDRSLRLWREDGGSVKAITELPDVPASLAISPDGTMVAIGGLGGEVRLLKLPGGELVKNFVAAPGRHSN